MQIEVVNGDNSIYRFSLDRRMYSRKAVLDAAYKFLDKAFIKFNCADNNQVEILLKLKNDGCRDDAQKLVDELYNEIIDQQIRCDLEERVGHIRNIIYEKAFSSLRYTK